MQAIREIFRVNLAVKSTERVLVFTDKIARREAVSDEAQRRRTALRHLAHLVEGVGRGLCKELIFLEYSATASHGKEPPRALWELAFGKPCADALYDAGLLAALLRKRVTENQMREATSIIRRYRSKAVDAVVALSNFSTSHTRFRTFLTELCGTRYASMPLFDLAMFDGPMKVDMKKMSKRTKTVATKLSKAVSARITTPEGTDISFSIKGRKGKADTGLLNKPGSFGNLPAGEAYLAPLEGTANGKLVILWGPTRKLESPITVNVVDGMVTEVLGEDMYVSVLHNNLSERKENRNIAELGVGTNRMATRPDNILESEKILGTVHIAFGDNASFGGTVKTPFHQDFVYFKPTLELSFPDGSKENILDSGEMNI
jgi:aminopeptidase